EVVEVGLAAPRGAGGADRAVDPEPGAQDRRVADAPGDLPGEAARGGDAADLAAGVDAVAVDGAVDVLGTEEAVGHHGAAGALAGLDALRRVEVVGGVGAALPFEPERARVLGVEVRLDLEAEVAR